MSHTLLINIARVISILGLGLLTFSAIGGTLLASRTAQKIKFLKGQTFKYHRALSITGTVLLLLHPVPLWLASKTTGITLASIFVPFLAYIASVPNAGPGGPCITPATPSSPWDWCTPSPSRTTSARARTSTSSISRRFCFTWPP